MHHLGNKSPRYPELDLVSYQMLSLVPVLTSPFFFHNGQTRAQPATCVYHLKSLSPTRCLPLGETPWYSRPVMHRVGLVYLASLDENAIQGSRPTAAPNIDASRFCRREYYLRSTTMP